MISGVLSGVRSDVGEICMTELSRHNAPLVMAFCGSKGSKINVAQMVACVGQQIIAGLPCAQRFPGSIASAFPQEVQGSAFQGLRAQLVLQRFDAHRILIPTVSRDEKVSAPSPRARRLACYGAEEREEHWDEHYGSVHRRQPRPVGDRRQQDQGQGGRPFSPSSSSATSST
ncbi:hypothetical protein L1887_44356 [Cichorium endivia]|nr:hypothetical protein L1887_44356 [Cichorium endivia]